MDGAATGAELWRLTLEHSPVGMALVDTEGRLLTVNQSLCDMLGHDAGELTRRGFQELTHPDDLDADLELFGRALAGGLDSYRLRKRYLHADGHVLWGDLSVALVRDAGGAPLHFVSQILDVTEQHATEARLRAANEDLERERQTLEAIFDTVNVGLLLIDADGRYERMNRRHQETMSLPFPDGHAGEAGQLGHVYFPDGRTRMAREDMPSFRAVQGEEFDDYRYWVGPDPLTRAAFSTSARQVRTPSGERRGAALAYQEITDLMHALQAKDEFVSSVSHELRTPLASMLGHLEMLCEDVELPARTLAQLQVVQRNAVRLRALVSDLLYLAQAGEGTIRLSRVPTDLVALVREAVEEARPLAAKAGAAVVVEAPPALVVPVDPQRVRQVVDNLLTNAVKYGGEAGRTTLALREEADEVVLEVRDTGIGIAAHELDLVFHRFFRGGEALAKHLPGTGLGLTIVGSIVEAHGGRVEVESEVGHGSTFRVTLPRAVPEG